MAERYRVKFGDTYLVRFDGSVSWWTTIRADATLYVLRENAEFDADATGAEVETVQ